MAYGHPYNSPQETLVRNLLCYGDIYTAQQLLRMPAANAMIDLPLRTITQLKAMKQMYGLSMHENNTALRDMCKPLEALDSLIITEVKRRASLHWLVLRFIAKLLAKRPKQRIITFENITTPQKYYTITCATRQRLIEHIFDRRILPLKGESFDGLLAAQLASAPLGCHRHILQGDTLPKSWTMLYIRIPHSIVNEKQLSALFGTLAL